MRYTVASVAQPKPPQRLQQEQRDDDSLEQLAEDGKDGYFSKDHQLYHLGKNEWGEEVRHW